MCSPLTLWCRWPCYCWVIMKVLAPTWCFLISPWRCYWDTSLQPYKGGDLAFLLTLVCYVWRWCLAGVVQLFSKSFFSCSAVFFLVLWLQGSSFCQGQLSLSVAISQFPVSSTPNLEYMRQNESPGNSPLCLPLYCKIPSWSAFFSLPFRVLLCLIYT